MTRHRDPDILLLLLQVDHEGINDILKSAEIVHDPDCLVCQILEEWKREKTEREATWECL